MLKLLKHKTTGKYVVMEYKNSQWNKKEFDTLKEAKKYYNQKKSNLVRQMKHEAITSMGLTRVKGALGGTYYE